MLTKRLPLLPLLAALTVIGTTSLFAQSKLDFQPNDTIRTILERQAGQVVELRMNSGEKIGGKVEKVNEELVHLSNLTGAEFYEAAVDLTAVSAVIHPREVEVSALTWRQLLPPRRKMRRP